ncbi:hypothetical protein [Nonomuraea insulae]|uniref:Cytochrome P450 n=1 Tax=Nonomuraea insulae TaxID=1616787 RepID=A0ABW1D8D6_9ACTN
MPKVLTLPFDRPDPLMPPPEYARLRETSPVARVRTPDGRPAWLVTSYDAAAAVLADRRFGLTPPGTPGSGNETLFQDGEAHARLRRLVAKAFSPRRVELLRERVERVADEHVATLALTGPPADLVAGLAAPMAITVIGELLGVDPGDRERFRVVAGGSATPSSSPWPPPSSPPATSRPATPSPPPSCASSPKNTGPPPPGSSLKDMGSARPSRSCCGCSRA